MERNKERMEDYDQFCGLVVKSSKLQIQRSRVRFPALPDFLRSSASGTRSMRESEELLQRKSSSSGLDDQD
jgi:hypothetical protein